MLTNQKLHTEIQEDDEVAAKVGEEIAKLTHCMSVGDRYVTGWGSKTAAGLARSVLAVVNGKEV